MNHIPVFILNELVILPGQEIKIDLSNEMSKKIIKSASKSNDNRVLVIAPKNPLESDPSFEDLPSIGVIAKIKSKIELSSGNLRIVLKGLFRVKIEKYFQNYSTGIIKCSYTEVELPKFDATRKTAVQRKLLSSLKEYIDSNKSVSNSILNGIDETSDLGVITDMITSFMPNSFSKKLEYMECINPLTRATNLIDDLQAEISFAMLDKELEEKLQENLENGQREYLLKEKLKEINKALGNTKEEEISFLEEAITSIGLEAKTEEKLLNEVRKYSTSSEYSPESSVIKNYLDTVLSLPWRKFSRENLDTKVIESTLNSTHYGLQEVKDRIIEYAHLKNVNPSLKAPVICLLGPPGVGKTSIAMSIAKALNREFYKISVGGLNDSTELIGSRRTYLGAAPGKIIQAIIKCKVNNPVLLIDEVDKMVKDYKGDPASTMLEILDETQNKFFVDNYIEEAFDLSRVMFILTANDIDNIPVTLLDRLEVINLGSYTVFEKIDIAKNYILKAILEEYKSDLKVNKDVLEYIVLNYTKEAGVRELKRVLEKLVRKVCVYEKDYKSITTSLASKYLGKQIDEYLPKIRDYGITNTLAYTTVGGLISHVEVSKHKGSGKITITGSAGDILKESARVAQGYIASSYDVDVNDYDLNIHFISGAQKKDGPSAGVPITVAMLSCYLNRVIDGDIAFTGEITLKGDILPIGGLKEKLIEASLKGIKTVYIPRSNELDLADVPMNVFNDIDLKLVSNFSEIYDVLFR